VWRHTRWLSNQFAAGIARLHICLRRIVLRNRSMRFFERNRPLLIVVAIAFSCRCTAQEPVFSPRRSRCGQLAGWAAAASRTRAQQAARNAEPRRRSSGRQAEQNGLITPSWMPAMIASVVVFGESWCATRAAHAARARPSLRGTTRSAVCVYSAGPRITSIAAWPAISATR
jgi:hypothetical protein